MKKSEVKEKFIKSAESKVPRILKASLNTKSAASNVKKLKKKYHGLPKDVLANILIKRACRKTKWEGAVNGLGVTGCEAAIVIPIPEATHKPAAVSGIIALLLADLTFTVKVQIQLMLEIGELYDCPFSKEDEDDAWLVFKAALGLKGTERVGIWGRFIFNQAAKKQFRKLLRTGIRRAIQNRIIKIASKKIGKYLAEKYVLRLIPVANSIIGYVFNNAVTKKIGKWSKIKSKIRSLSYNQIDIIKKENKDILVWILPIIFYISTSNDKLTDNDIVFYSQALKYMNLSIDQKTKVEELIDNEELIDIFSKDFSKILNVKLKKAIFDIAITSAALNLKITEEFHVSLAKVAGSLKIKYSKNMLKEKIRYIKR